jgi:hypothetical protein
MGAVHQTGSDSALAGSVFPCEVDMSLDDQ